MTVHIGVIGCGFVGGSLSTCFKNKGIIMHEYDKFKEIGTLEEVIKESTIIFLCLPTLFNETTQKYDTVPLEETCNALQKNNYNGTVIIKSTVTPGTCEDLATRYNIDIIHNPEFLTASTALQDFENQKHIVIGSTSKVSKESTDNVVAFYEKLFDNAYISKCTSFESEVMKLVCNCFYSVKVQFFNEVYALMNKDQESYNNVIELCLRNGWINPMHTMVPGTDGKLSFGGLCFPKDTRALSAYMKEHNIINGVLSATVEEQKSMRPDTV